MGKIAALAGSGLEAAARHRARTAAAAACVVCVLTPFVAGFGIARGLDEQIDASIARGADVHVTGMRFGRPVPVPLAAADLVRAVPGVDDVVPRVVAAIRLGAEHVEAVLVGLPAERFGDVADGLVDGRFPSAAGRNELVIGSQLARRLALKPGAMIPPFYRNEAGERVSTVVGVFRSDLPVWEANVVLTDTETATRICDARAMTSSLLVSCRPEYVDSVREAIVRIDSLAPGDPQGPIRPRVMTRADARAVLPAGALRREGVFHLHFVLAFALAIPLLLVTSGVGLAERRRETGLLKALGWHTDEVLVRGVVESVVIAALGASVAVIAAWAWLTLANGWGVASVFLPGTDASPGFAVPFSLAPVPVLVAFVISFVVTATGTLVSTWRAAAAPPSEAMR